MGKDKVKESLSFHPSNLLNLFSFNLLIKRASYTGDFKDGLKDGNGIFKYPSGNYYEGEFKKDAKHGQGTMFWLDENERYIGSWENNF